MSTDMLRCLTNRRFIIIRPIIIITSPCSCRKYDVTKRRTGSGLDYWEY